MAMEDDEWKKLGLQDRCTHKLWKARVSAYEELTNLFKQIDDEKSPEFAKYLGLVKKFVTDSNVLGQEKGLEATLAYIENYALAGKTVSEVMAGIVTKCFSSPKLKIRETAGAVTLMYIEIEKQELVVEELVKGLDQKNPKIVVCCIQIYTDALRKFGSKIVTVKPVIKKINGLFSDRDKNVRDEARALAIELYRWLGPGFKQHLSGLQPVQLTELEAEFAKLGGEAAVPSRYIRSHQQKQVQSGGDVVDENGEVEQEQSAEQDQQLDLYDIADPVDILSKLPKNFYENVEAKKWQERKEALESLENLLKAPKLESGDYGDLVRALKKIIQKDSNVVVVALAGKCLASLASGLKKRFQQYAGFCLTVLFEKFKEKKQNVVSAIRDALDAIYLSVTLESILEDALEALNSKNPSVRIETTLFLARAFTHTQPSVLNKKLLKAYTGAFLKNLNEPDPGVREASSEAVGTLMKLVGEKPLNTYLCEIEKDNLKMSKIKEFSEKAVINVKIVVKKEKAAPQAKPASVVEKPPVKKAPRKPAPGIGGTFVKKKSTVSSASNGTSSGAMSRATSSNNLDQEDEEEVQTPGSDSLPRTDISALITEALIEEISDKNWKVRNEALIKVTNIISDAKLIKSNIGDLPQALAARLVDSNGKIVQTTLNICENIATAMGPPCRQHVRVLLPGFIQGLGDSKAWIRSASVSCMSLWGELCAYREFFEGEVIADALKGGSPTLRSELWAWLAEKLPKIKSVPKDELLLCIPHLYANLEDRNVDVRKNAHEAVLGFMWHLNYEAMVKQTDKVKPSSKAVVVAALDKARPSLPLKPLPKAKQAPVEEKAVRGKKPVATSKNAVKPKVPAVVKPVSARKKEDDVDTSPLMTINNLKHQRTIDENKLKVLKWNFTTPREEFVELLKEQMLQADINKTLIMNMFHSDFRYHLKAIDSLMEDLPVNPQALMSNLDLILKWVTLRFFDTNPAVLIKALDYVYSVFIMLNESQYQMFDNEGGAFIPYLVVKSGDPKDGIRSLVRSLFKQLGTLFPITKLFTYVMEGLKSKNARQRTECLDLMGGFIEEYGACLKEAAKQISDRDNAVRNAALNCIVQAYFIVGEKIFKMLGQISEKDMSLLEERVKRAKRPSRVLQVESSSLSANTSPQRETIVNQLEEPNDYVEEEEVEEDDIPTVPSVVLPSQASQEAAASTAMFQLDPELIKRLDSIKCVMPKINLLEFDLEFLNEEIAMPSKLDVHVKAMPMTPPKPILPNDSFTRNPGLSQVSPRSAKDPVLERTINNVGSPDIATALKAIEQMQEILQSNKASSMAEYENQFMSAVATQLNILQSQDPRTNSIVSRVYRALLTVIDAFYINKGLGQKVTVDVLKSLLNHLITLLLQAKLEDCPSGDAYVRVVNLHCVKIIERSNHSHITCALVKLLHECVTLRGPPRQTDLVMKCLWRLIKLIPNWTGEVEYDDILYEVHIFLKDYPTSWWKTQTLDTPVRTVKTIIHSLAKIKGSQLMIHLGKIHNTSESELESYILRLLKSLKLEEIKQVPLKSEKTEPKKTLSRSVHTMLTDIFQKIGIKEESKEGFNLLYDFLKQHPDADIDQFLQKSSNVFQDYISNGIKEVESARKETKTENHISSINENDASYVDDPNKTAAYYEARLEMWKRLWSEVWDRIGLD